MTKVTNDALVIQLAMELTGDQDAFSRIATLNNFITAINDKTKSIASAESLRDERMSVEGRYNPDIQRDLEIERAIKLTDRLNLSAETQLSILNEIYESHRKSVALQHEQFSKYNMPGDDMVAQFRKNQADQVAAEEELLNARKRAAKETERLQDEELSNYQRYVAKASEAKDLLNKGVIDNEGYILRVAAARKEYEILQKAEADKATLVQNRIDAEKQAAADEKALWTARLQALDDTLEEEKRLQAAAVSDAAIEATQRKAAAAINATTAADNEANAERQKAINLLHSLEDATQRYTRVSDELRAHLDAGTITEDQYEQGLANIERRQRSMAGGANNVAYAIGNTVTGLEDFVTVLSITGFGMEGFSAATRAASNNVGQAVRSLGTEASAIYAPLVSIGMVLAGAAIPAVYKWAMGAEAAEDATRRWNREMEVAVRLAGELGRLEIRKLNFDAEVEDIRKMDDSEAVKERYNDLAQKEKLLLAEIQKTLKESEAAANTIFDRLVPTETIEDFNAYVDGIGEEFGADVEAGFRQRLKDMQTEFITIAVEKDAEEARKVLLSRMRKMQEDMETMRPGSSGPIASMTGFLAMGSDGGFFNDFVNVMPELFNDAAVIDQIEELEGKIEELSREDSEAARIKKEELIETRDLLKELHDQYMKALDAEATKAAEIQAEAQHLDQQSMENELEKLKIQQHKNSLLGAENEAERRLFDLALRRREIMESGLAAPDVLEGLMNQELEAIAAELEQQIARAEELIYNTASMTEPEAYTSANKQILDAMGKEDTEQQEMIDLLKAIRDHLAGTATLQVEVI